MSTKSSGKRHYSPRVQHKREQVRLEILQAAKDILRDEGADAVTLASVAGILGMTKQALYHYFRSKEDLMRALVSALIDDEVGVLVAAVEAVDSGEETLGTLIRAFYDHYIDNLDALRAVYCQSQLYVSPDRGLDKTTVRDEINPRTQHLFDRVEAQLAGHSRSARKRERLRRLAFTAWTSALGLLTILGVADAVNDPLLHSDEELLETLTTVFDEAAL